MFAVRNGWRAASGIFVAAWLVLLALPAAAEPPETVRLLPSDTILLARIPSTEELATRWQQTGLGRIVQEPQLQPFIAHLYGKTNAGLAGPEQQRDLDLQGLLRALKGELVLALVPEAQRGVAWVLIARHGPDGQPLAKLVELLEKTLVDAGAERSEEQAGGTRLVVVDRPGARADVVYFQRDQTLVVTTTRQTALDVVARWSAPAEETLAANRKVAAWIDAPGGGEGTPQVVFFIDPVLLMRSVAAVSTQAKVAAAMLPALGLDGVQGIAARLWLATTNFDERLQVDVWLDSPRSGVLELVAFEPGEAEPPCWLPGDVADYYSVHWNAEQTYRSLGKLVDSFQSEGALRGQVERRIAQPLGVDFEKDLLAASGGRLIHATRYQQPAQLDGRAALVAIELKDAAAFSSTFEKLVAAGGETLEKKTFRSTTYYEWQAGIQPDQPEPAGNAKQANDVEPLNQPGPVRRRPRPPRLCLTLLDGYLIGTDRASFLHSLIATQEGALEPLADAIDYKLFASRLRRQAGSAQPALIMFSRREEFFRNLYQLAGSEAARERLRQAAERSPVAKNVQDLLEIGSLPPFELLAKHLAPSGGILIDDETGIHYTGFTLRRE